jgi:spore germination cell wall hydrolase CwlJ-like protein
MLHNGTLRGFALAGLIAIAASTHAFAIHDQFDDPPAVATDLDTRDIVAETRLYCMTLAIYFEGGSTGESEEGQRHIARVIHARAQAKRKIWGGGDICDVVFYKRGGVCQFSFACLPNARRTAKPGARWDYSQAIARDELEGRSEVEADLIRYYMNPALTPDRNACRFRKEFVQVVEAGRHQFFREPTTAERAELNQSTPTECQRLAQASQKKKSKAKSAKSKRFAALAKHKKKGKKLRYARK